jgi:hypothetical protein
MRRAVAGLILVSFLAPLARYEPAEAAVEACACPPKVCPCDGHEHASGHAAMCAMSNGGRCSIESSEARLNHLSKQSLDVPVERDFSPCFSPSNLPRSDGRMSCVAGFVSPEDPPPRLNS